VGAAAELEKAVLLAEAPDRPRPGWLFDAHFLLAEAMRSSGNRDKAIEHYRRFLATSPPDNAYRPDAERALLGLGAAPPPK
jgi:tetratricopeptide (TPR) repeat protein